MDWKGKCCYFVVLGTDYVDSGAVKIGASTVNTSSGILLGLSTVYLSSRPVDGVFGTI